MSEQQQETSSTESSKAPRLAPIISVAEPLQGQGLASLSLSETQYADYLANPRARIVSFFNHKGGVGKTTALQAAAWVLASKGKSVIVFDLDSQCNATQLMLGAEVEASYGGDYEQFYRHILTEDPAAVSISAALRPSVNNNDVLMPHLLEISHPVFTTGRAPHKQGHLYLLRGDRELDNFADSLSEIVNVSRHQQSSRASRGALFALLHLALQCAYAYNADYVLFDHSPTRTIFNRLAVASCDFLITPCGPDFFSLQSLRTIHTDLVSAEWDKGFNLHRYDMLVEHSQGYERGPDGQLHVPEGAVKPKHPYPLSRQPVRFLGTIISRFKFGKDYKPPSAVTAFINFIQAETCAIINDATLRATPPMVFPQDEYQRWRIPEPMFAEFDDPTAKPAQGPRTGTLALIPEFTRLFQVAKMHGVPVPFLCEEHLGRVGPSGAEQRAANLQAIPVIRRFFVHLARVIRGANGEALMFTFPFPPFLAGTLPLVAAPATAAAAHHHSAHEVLLPHPDLID